MRKLLLVLLISVGMCLAAGVADLRGPQPLTITEELYWDTDQDGNWMQGADRGVWFIMPFDGQLITVRTKIGDAGTYHHGYTIIFCDRGVDGLPDESNTYGTYEYPGGEASGPGWWDVDVRDLEITLNEGEEFFYLYLPTPGLGPKVMCDSSGDGSHNVWRPSGQDWRTSVLGPYHMRVIVEDDTGSRVELSTWGQIKHLE